MDERLADLAARGRRWQQLRLAAAGAVVVALVVGGLVLLDRADRRRGEAALQDAAVAVDELLRDAETQDAQVPHARAADEFLADPPVELPGVGTYVLADWAGQELRVCVELDPWLGSTWYSCVQLDEPGAEPRRTPTSGGTSYVLGPE